MIEWLPQVCRELHGELFKIYWIMFLPLVVFLLVLEILKSGSQVPDGGKVLVRSVISILLLISFKETINMIAFMGDGIASKIDGLAQMGKLMDIFAANFSREAPSLYKVRELFIFLLNYLSYFLAYFGVFISEALIHFSWSVLYVCAPLMILCYIPESTVNVCKNLYKGLLTVITWKAIYSILGVLLLKLAVEKTTDSSDNLIATAVINLCIAISILFVPFFSKSLIGDGIAGFSSGVAGMATAGAMRVFKQSVKPDKRRELKNFRQNVNEQKSFNRSTNQNTKGTI
jgi:hypothetical protein